MPDIQYSKTIEVFAWRDSDGIVAAELCDISKRKILFIERGWYSEVYRYRAQG
ncbi:hypothetical protein Alches_24660 [Alicyclobacillus hesperidum subsp. aegles]|nr:hypothetical protein Alches_24660 [Alicyclobacillus hesperidum subsp. aegles]